jgi:hypothetical protein
MAACTRLGELAQPARGAVKRHDEELSSAGAQLEVLQAGVEEGLVRRQRERASLAQQERGLVRLQHVLPGRVLSGDSHGEAHLPRRRASDGERARAAHYKSLKALFARWRELPASPLDPQRRCSGSSLLFRGRPLSHLRLTRSKLGKFACYMWEGYRRHTGPELDKFAYYCAPLADALALHTHNCSDYGMGIGIRWRGIV